MLRRKYQKIVDFFNKMIGEDEVDLTKEFLKRKMSNLINNLLPSLFNGLMTNPTDEMIDWYKKYFGRIPKTKEDLKAILNEREKQFQIYNQMFPEIVLDDGKEPFDFDAFVNGLEITNGVQINRKDRLYTIGAHYKSAVQMNKQQEKIKANG